MLIYLDEIPINVSDESIVIQKNLLQKMYSENDYLDINEEARKTLIKDIKYFYKMNQCFVLLIFSFAYPHYIYGKSL